MNYQTIQYSLADTVARLTLNRPDRLNSFNGEMHAEVRDAIGRVGKDGARVLVLTGADLGESIERNYKPLILSLRSLAVPTIAAVNGVAAFAEKRAPRFAGR